MSTISAGTTVTTALVASGDTTGALTFQVNGTTTAATISSGGAVNIGRTANLYGETLSVAGYAVIGANSGGTGQVIVGNDGTTGINGTVDNVAYVTRTNNTERMRVDSGGNLLIGTTSNNFASSNHRVVIAQDSSVANPFGINNLASGTGTSNCVFFARNGTQTGGITNTGTTTAFNTLSDRRLKENITPADDAGSIVDAIQIVKYDWKVGGHNRYGVIAQDLHDVFPEAVAEGDDGDEIEKTWGVDYSKLVPILVKEIQSLRARVTALESK